MWSFFLKGSPITDRLKFGSFSAIFKNSKTWNQQNSIKTLSHIFKNYRNRFYVFRFPSESITADSLIQSWWVEKSLSLSSVSDNSRTRRSIALKLSWYIEFDEGFQKTYRLIGVPGTRAKNIRIWGRFYRKAVICKITCSMSICAERTMEAR